MSWNCRQTFNTNTANLALASAKVPLQGCGVSPLMPPKKLEILLRIRIAVYRLPFIHPLLHLGGTNAATRDTLISSKVRFDYAWTLLTQYVQYLCLNSLCLLCQINKDRNYSFKRVAYGFLSTNYSNFFTAFK